MTQFIEASSGRRAFQGARFPWRALTRTVPAIVAVSASALTCAWVLHTRLTAVSHVDAPSAVDAPQVSFATKPASNPYGVLVDPGFSADVQPAWVAKSISLQASLGPSRPASVPVASPIARLSDAAPLPPRRPAEFALLADPPVPIARPETRVAKPTDNGSSPDNRTFIQKLFGLGQPTGPKWGGATPESGGGHEPRLSLTGPSGHYDRYTAVYDLSAHTVYLPNGSRLEAHSGLGDRMDDPRHVNEPGRGATPPQVYELTPREQSFHGVQALRMKPVGSGDVFGRAGFLAHSYMLGPNGDSNGCVSFKDYDAFLQAYQNGQVKRLAVVSRLD